MVVNIHFLAINSISRALLFRAFETAFILKEKSRILAILILWTIFIVFRFSELFTSATSKVYKATTSANAYETVAE